jgi:hypothetical protein
MAYYNFKRGTKLYIVYSNNQYEFELNDISFGQTFAEESYPVKTLQQPNKFFEGAIINKANPANFSFTIYAIKEPDFKILYDLGCKLNTSYNLNFFDAYIKSTDYIFKLERAVITDIVFNIIKTEPLSITYDGQAAVVSKVSSIPGTPVSRSATTSYNIIKEVDFSLDSTTFDRVFSASLELKNNINWFGHHTVQGSASTMYPYNYTLDSRSLTGSVGVYLVDTSALFTHSVNVPLYFRAGESNLTGIECDAPLVSITNRVAVEEAYTQYFDWRLMSNPTDLTTILTYLTLE